MESKAGFFSWLTWKSQEVRIKGYDQRVTHEKRSGESCQEKMLMRGKNSVVKVDD